MLSKEQYEVKREERIARLLAAAERADKEGSSRRDRAHQMAECIPFGQPILIGHYSEKRDRNFRARIDSNYRKGWELYEKANELKSRAESAASNDAIYSDDPEATDKLTDKVAELEKLQATYKAINKAHAAYLKNPASLDTCDLSDKTKDLIRNYKPAYSWEPHPVAPYQLTNLSARIRQTKQRAAIVSRKQALEDREEVIGDVKIEYAPSENRIRISYPGRVDLATYKLLKQHGFRAKQTEGEFSGYYNNNCLYFIKIHIKKEA